MYKRTITVVVAALTISMCCGGAFAQNGKPRAGAVRDPIGERLDTHLSQLIAKGFSGALLFAKKGGVIM
jgi:hypothetical protein